MNEMPCKSIPVINKTSTEKRKEDRFHYHRPVQPWKVSYLTWTQIKVKKGVDRWQQFGFIGSKEGIQNDLAAPLQPRCSQHYTPAVTQIHSSSVLVYRLLHQTIHLLHLLQPQSHVPALSETDDGPPLIADRTSRHSFIFSLCDRPSSPCEPFLCMSPLINIVGRHVLHLPFFFPATLYTAKKKK